MTPLQRAIAAVERKFDRVADYAVVALTECPPSVNNLFAHVAKNRYETREYRGWKQRMGLEVLIQRPPTVRGSIEIRLRARRPQLRRDLDNILKPALDLMVKCRVIEDDRLVERIVAEWDDAVAGTLIEVWTFPRTRQVVA